MKISNLIKEELQTLLNEKATVVGGESFNFTQPVKSPAVGFYNYDSFSSEYDADVSESSIAITWQVSFWVNQYGIESFTIDGERVAGQYKLQLRDKQSDELKQEIVKDIAEIKWKFETEDNVTLLLHKSLYVTGLDFDFKTQTCRLYF
jgi:hypothetical protein